MQIVHSHQFEPAAVSPGLHSLLEGVSENHLRDWVRHIARPRHFTAEADQNRAVGDWLADMFRSFGYRSDRQGASSNIIASLREPFAHGILVGGHYDSVPNCPGADDNASAVAAMLGCAEALAQCSPPLPVLFVAFNREEEGIIGSDEFVAQLDPSISLACVHILEMVGFASSAPDSQRLPTGLPIQLRETGDFLGLLANEQSAAAMHLILQHSRSCVPDLPVTGLQVVPGAERLFPVLARSDHVPFWTRKIPAVMWTDTAEFRNPHYHRVTDTPDTLDYSFLHRVTKLLTAVVATQAAIPIRASH